MADSRLGSARPADAPAGDSVSELTEVQRELDCGIHAWEGSGASILLGGALNVGGLVSYLTPVVTHMVAEAREEGIEEGVDSTWHLKQIRALDRERVALAIEADVKRWFGDQVKFGLTTAARIARKLPLEVTK